MQGILISLFSLLVFKCLRARSQYLSRLSRLLFRIQLLHDMFYAGFDTWAGDMLPQGYLGLLIPSCWMSGFAGVCRSPFAVLSVSCSVSTHL